MEVENWDEKTLEILSLFLKLRQELNQFDHMINVSIKKAKTREVLINAFKKLDSFFSILLKFLTEYYSIQDPSFKDKKLTEKLEFFKDEFLGYHLIFDYIPTLKKILRAIEEGNYEVVNEFKKDIGLKIKVGNEEEVYDVKFLREILRKILEFMDIVERIVKEVKSGKIERSYKV